jgi:RimJ/RimL family protein N-acetyltransferase
VEVLCKYGFEELGLVRIFTGIYEWNPASMRVLEKNGFVKEGIERKGIIKDGKVIDAHVWAKVKE